MWGRDEDEDRQQAIKQIVNIFPTSSSDGVEYLKPAMHHEGAGQEVDEWGQNILNRKDHVRFSVEGSRVESPTLSPMEDEIRVVAFKDGLESPLLVADRQTEKPPMMAEDSDSSDDMKAISHRQQRKSAKSMNSLPQEEEAMASFNADENNHMAHLPSRLRKSSWHGSDSDVPMIRTATGQELHPVKVRKLYVVAACESYMVQPVSPYIGLLLWYRGTSQTVSAT